MGLVKARLIEAGDWIFDLDARAYLPVGDVAASQDVVTGFRTSQRVTYKIPSTRWTLGSYSYIRTWVYGNNGRGFRNDLEIYLSPFAHYRITSNLVATLWTDVLQLGHQLNSATGLSNLPMDIEPGVLWEITSKISVNPYLNFIPQSLSLNSTSIGMVINVAVL